VGGFIGAFFDGGSFLSTWVRPISGKITVFNSSATGAVVSCRICIGEFLVINGFIFIALTRGRIEGQASNNFHPVVWDISSPLCGMKCNFSLNFKGIVLKVKASFLVFTLKP
jgi:hypothetical protein